MSVRITFETDFDDGKQYAVRTLNIYRVSNVFSRPEFDDVNDYVAVYSNLNRVIDTATFQHRYGDNMAALAAEAIEALKKGGLDEDQPQHLGGRNDL